MEYYYYGSGINCRHKFYFIIYTIIVMTEQIRYAKSMKEQSEIFESLCARCGECCGSQDGDPCACLKYDHAQGVYFCEDYENRIGEQKTVTGKSFNCVPITEVARKRALRPHCAYRIILNSASLSYL